MATLELPRGRTCRWRRSDSERSLVHRLRQAARTVRGGLAPAGVGHARDRRSASASRSLASAQPFCCSPPPGGSLPP